MQSSLFGLIFGLGILIYSISATTSNSIIYMNFVSLLIVFGGTMSVAVITYGLKEVVSIMMLFFRVFTSGKYADVVIVNELIDLADLAHRNGRVTKKMIDGNIHPFAKDGLIMIQNNFTADQLEHAMETSAFERSRRFENKIGMLQVISKYPPAFGMMGTIIGLVAVLQRMGNSGDLGQLGPSMAVALITTLYGIFLANYIFNPIADNLTSRTQADLRVRRIIIEGIRLIQKKEDPIFIKQVLLGYIPPMEHAEIKSININHRFQEAS